jgi:hypothetical protein
MKLVSNQTARLARIAIVNEWSEAARAASIEARRRKAMAKGGPGYIKYTKRDHNALQPKWVNKWEEDNELRGDQLDPKLIKFKDRLVRQNRPFASGLMRAITRGGRALGIIQLMEKISGHTADHASWVDKRTGYRYDFQGSPGNVVTGYTQGRLVETAPDGTKRELKGPHYNLFKKNCQDANRFLPQYIKKFNQFRAAERRQAKAAKEGGPVLSEKHMEHKKKSFEKAMRRGADQTPATPVLATANVRTIIAVLNGGPGSGNHGHKGIPGHRGGSAAKSGAMIVSPRNVLGVPSASGYKSLSADERRENIRTHMTKTAKLAELYTSHAKKLEAQRRRKWLPLKHAELKDLIDTHSRAAQHLYEAADQSTLMEDSSIEAQQQRLDLAHYHAKKAQEYSDRINRRHTGGALSKSLGQSFLRGLIGGSVEEVTAKVGQHLGSTAGDIVAEGIRGGYEKGKQMSGHHQRLAEQERERAMKYTGAVRSSIMRKADAVSRQKFGWGETAKWVGKKAAQSAQARAAEHGKRLVRGGRDLDFEDYRAMRKAEDEIAKEEMLSSRSKWTNELGLKMPSSSGSSTGSSRRRPNISADDLLRFGMQLKQAEEAQQNTTNAEATDFMEQPTANVTGEVRRERLHDREYLVAPLTMIVPGVLAGSKGPLLYPEEEVRKNPNAWNGMPIVVNHPMKDGMPVEARSPSVLEKYQIGTVFNTRYNGKLVAEGWFDVDRTRKTNVGIYEHLVNNKPIELSTGLFTDNEASEGEWNGRRYTYVARNYRPDHLAILLGSRGACSLKDGCGVLINKLVSPQVRELRALIVGNTARSLVNVEYDEYGDLVGNSWSDAARLASAIARRAKRAIRRILGGKKLLEAAKYKRALLGRTRSATHDAQSMLRKANTEALTAKPKTTLSDWDDVSVESQKNLDRALKMHATAKKTPTWRYKAKGMARQPKVSAAEVDETAKRHEISNLISKLAKRSQLPPTYSKELAVVGNAGILSSVGRIGRGLATTARGVGGVGASVLKSRTGRLAVAGGAIGAGGYALGKKKAKATKPVGVKLPKVTRNAMSDYTTTGMMYKAIGKPKQGESKMKTGARWAAHGAGGAAAGAGGALAGAAIGSTAMPVVGTLVGGAAGAAIGSWAARRQSARYGKGAANASDVGSIVGSMGVGAGAGATKVAGTAVKAGKVARFAKGTGKLAADIGTYTGTSMALDKVGGSSDRIAAANQPRAPRVPKPGAAPPNPAPKKPRIPKPPMATNAWTEEARKKSAESRRLRGGVKHGFIQREKEGVKELGDHGIAGGIIAGSIGGIGAGAGAKLAEKSNASAKGLTKRVAQSFAKRPTVGDAMLTAWKPGMGRKVIDLLKRIRIR